MNISRLTPKCRRCGGREFFKCDTPETTICWRCCNHRMIANDERKWFFCMHCDLPASALYVASVTEWIDGPIFSS